MMRSSSADENSNMLLERWLASMTLEEQIGQMSQIDISMLLRDGENHTKVLNMDLVEEFIGKRGIGSVLNTVPVPWSAQDYRQAAIQMQQIALKYKRPPVIWGLDSVHGANYVHGAILTPQPINIAATFNRNHSKAAGILASRDTRAAGINWLFSPLLGIALEPRWSRVYETFGEDPLLVGEMAAAMIAGIQQPDTDPAAIPSRAAACAKHFVGYSKPESGHDRAPSWIPSRHLYQYMVPPWKRATKENVLTVMESYTETDGVPNVANPSSLYYLLRMRLNFNGVLVTDYEEMRNLHNWHHVVPTDEDAIVTSLREGSVDMSMIPYDVDGFRSSIQNGVKNHAISEDRIKRSADRVLKLKQVVFAKGETLTEEDPNLERIGTDEEDVLNIVRESIVLTKNVDSTLPLTTTASSHLKVLITGPTADSKTYQSGGWTHQWQGAPNDDWFTYGSTVLQAFKAEDTLTVSFRCGTTILGEECEADNEDTSSQSVVDEVKQWVGLGPTNSIGRAVAAADDVDVVVVCVGEEAYAEKPGDLRSLRLPDGQYDLVRALGKNSKAKIILVYFGGRTRLLADMVENVDAVLIGFLPGPSAGRAMVDIVLGRTIPSARLPVTYPKFEDGGGLPYYHPVSSQCTTGNGTFPHYVYSKCEVEWPFGHGLSYTSFEYSDLTASGGIDTDLHISVSVKNTGTMRGYETVMFFTFDEFRSTTPEYKRLRAFEKVELSPGDEVTVEVSIPVEDLMFIGPHDDRHYVLQPSMTSWVGVGYATDCRQGDAAANKLCVRLQSNHPDHEYSGACEHACELWSRSGCLAEYNVKSGQCLSMCTSINKLPMDLLDKANDGWGWQYVDCLESVIWGMQKGSSEQTIDKTDCWKMTAMCRDIFQTGKLNEFGVGDSWGITSSPNYEPNAGSANFSVSVVALVCGLFTTFFIVRVMRGKGFRGPPQGVDDDRRSIQFTKLTEMTEMF